MIMPSTFNPATWMKDMDCIQDRPLKDIVIPGSHDAGTYEMYLSVADNASKCQDVCIFDQLEAGSRYLDLRAEYWSNSDAYWMHHGTDVTNVKLETVLADIRKFLEKENSEEIVVATLLIKEDSGWKWACDQVSKHLVTPEDLQGKSFAEATPNDLRALEKRLVLLRQDHSPQYACMDREGAYGNSQLPQDYIDRLDAYQIWDD
jgi:Phosphatidylinositol-specific phospholipase C, X domain